MPTELRAEIARETSIAEHAWEAARERLGLRRLPPPPRAGRRAQAPLRRVLRVRAPLRRAARRLRARDDDRRSARRARAPARRRRPAGRERSSTAAPSSTDDRSLGDFPDAAQDALAREVAAAPAPRAGAPGGWTRPCTRSRSGSRSRTCASRRDTTPSTSATALWAVIHEVGPRACTRRARPGARAHAALPLASRSGFDESQSRLWENWVGRGRPYMARLLPLLRERFRRAFDELEPSELYRAANAVEPSLIRVEADEVTYNLHIVLRFELELQIFDGALALTRPPRGLERALSRLPRPRGPRRRRRRAPGRPLAGGAFGYFPTYSLGNVIAAQLWELANEELPDLDDQIAAGELEPLRALLRRPDLPPRRQARAGRDDRAGDRRAARPGPLLRQLEAKYGELYGLDVTRRRRSEMSERTEYAPGTPSWADNASADPEGRRVLLAAVRLGHRGRRCRPRRRPYFMARLRGKDVAALGSHPRRGAGGLEHLRHGHGRRETAEKVKDAGGHGDDGAVRRLRRRPDGGVRRPAGAPCHGLEAQSDDRRRLVNEPRHALLERTRDPRRRGLARSSTARSSAGRPSTWTSAAASTRSGTRRGVNGRPPEGGNGIGGMM